MGDDLEAYYSIAAAWAQASKSMLLPEGTPDSIVDAYTEAVSKMVEDPEFKEKPKKYWSLPFDIGEEVALFSRKPQSYGEYQKQLNAVLKKTDTFTESNDNELLLVT